MWLIDFRLDDVIQATHFLHGYRPLKILAKEGVQSVVGTCSVVVQVAERAGSKGESEKNHNLR